jgi:hypothetical protein
MEQTHNEHADTNMIIIELFFGTCLITFEENTTHDTKTNTHEVKI